VKRRVKSQSSKNRGNITIRVYSRGKITNLPNKYVYFSVSMQKRLDRLTSFRPRLTIGRLLSRDNLIPANPLVGWV
jgi:hypothetical protein